MENIFNIGDKVTYKKGIKQLRKYGHVFMNTDMFRLRGKILEISDIKEKKIMDNGKEFDVMVIKCKDYPWDFSAEMFDKIVVEEE